MSDLSVELNLISGKPTNGAETAFRAQITNKGERPVAFHENFAQNPALVLEIQGEDGVSIGLPPPPPSSEDELKETRDIQPGESISIDYYGTLDLYQKSGAYRVRFYSKERLFGGSEKDPVKSEWLEFEVTREANPDPERWEYVAPVAEIRGVFYYFWYWWHWIWCFFRKILGLERCDRQISQEVDVARTEVMSDAPPGFEAWNGTYSWRARFRVELDQRDCSVTIIVRIQANNAGANLSNAQRTAWETAIQNAWSNIFKFCCDCCCCTNGYSISLDVQFVNTNAHHAVSVQGSTTNMTNWGNNDTTAISHEMGHMLGALDEYYTVDGTAWGQPFQNGAGIMNNPNEAPLARHLDLVRDTVRAMLGTTCVTKAAGDPC